MFVTTLSTRPDEFSFLMFINVSTDFTMLYNVNLDWLKTSNIYLCRLIDPSLTPAALYSITTKFQILISLGVFFSLHYNVCESINHSSMWSKCLLWVQWFIPIEFTLSVNPSSITPAVVKLQWSHFELHEQSRLPACTQKKVLVGE